MGDYLKTDKCRFVEYSAIPSTLAGRFSAEIINGFCLCSQNINIVIFVDDRFPNDTRSNKCRLLIFKRCP